MQKPLVAYVHQMTKGSNQIGRGIKYLILALIGILIADTVARYGFNYPLQWGLEMCQFILGSMFLLGGGYALLHESHVRMDILWTKWSAKKRAIADAATFSIMGIYLGVVIKNAIPQFWFSFVHGQETQSNWAPVIWPIKLVLIIGTVLLLLQGVAHFIRDLSILRTGNDRGETI